LTELVYITDVNKDEFSIDDKGILNILNIKTNQVSGLDALMAQKADSSTISSLRTALDSHV
jgi:hypothetical protein